MDMSLKADRRYARLLTMLATTALVAPLAATPAFAQASDETEARNEIIVTAQRREERLEEVPMSVAVVTAETLANAGVTNLRDLANVTTGYQLGSGGAFPQPAIRGVTTVINGTYENNVAVYVDGIYQPVAQAIAIDLPNVDNIQVLKGPQGTLYGRNATGGALLLTTSNPGDTWRGKVEATYARFDDKRLSGYVAGPLSETIGISASGYMRRSDGYMKLASRTTPGKSSGGAIPIDQDAFRVKLRANLGESLTATLLYSYTRVADSRSNVYSPIENVPSNPYATRPGGLTRPTELGTYAYDIGNVMETKQHEGGLTLEWDTGIGTLKSVTAYSDVKTDNRFDFDGTYIPSNYTTSLLHERTFQQYLDYAINAIDNVDLIVGATYFHDKLTNEGTRNFSGLNPANPGTTPGSLATDYVQISLATGEQKKEAWAVYGDVTFHASEQLSINLGGRYSEEKHNVFAQSVSGVAVLARPALSNSAKFSKFTPRVSLRYEISPRTNVYASYSQGFRSGTFNLSQPLCVQTNPACWQPAAQESIDAFEVGFKTAGSNFRAELAGFYYKYKNLQVSTTRTLGGFPVVDITNAPKARIYGIEGNVEFEPTENLKLRLGATWLNARYGAGFSFGGVGVTNAGGVGINTNGDPLKTYLNVSQVQDLSGLMMSRAPNFAANAGVEYLIPNGDGGLRFSANVKYTSAYVVTNPSVWGAAAGVPADRQRQQRFMQDGYALLNASVTWTDPTDHYYVRVWGTNLTDVAYRIHYSGTASNGTYSPNGEPMSFGGTVGYKF